MAGLKQLKRVVTAAMDAGDGGRVFYLLDEILQGTNTAERHVAVRRIIARLVGSGAVGAVTTHDLTLADAPEIKAAAVPMHFSEEVIERDGVTEMLFDYRLQPGIARSRNALKLMAMLGLDDGGDVEERTDPAG